MKLFLDTNVLLDNFENRQPFNQQVKLFFAKADRYNWQFYVTAISFLNTHYILKKKISNDLSIKIISDFVSKVEVVSVTKEMLLTAAQSDFKDFEDAVQYQCALSIVGIDGIITRNKKDFKKSHISIYTPFEALDL